MLGGDHVTAVRRIHAIHQIAQPTLVPRISKLSFAIHSRKEVLVLAKIDVFIGSQVGHGELRVVQ